MNWGELSLKERHKLYKNARSTNPSISYSSVRSMQDGGIINQSLIESPRNTLVDDLKSGNILNYLDIPSKSLTYLATTMSRGPGNGVYDVPSNVINDWEVGNNLATKLAGDILLDPLLVIPYGKLNYKKALDSFKVLTNPKTKKLNATRKALESYDNTNKTKKSINNTNIDLLIPGLFNGNQNNEF